MKFICEIDCNTPSLLGEDGTLRGNRLSRVVTDVLVDMMRGLTGEEIIDGDTGASMGRWFLGEAEEDEDDITVGQLRSIMTDDELESMQDAIDRMQGEHD